MKLSSRHCRDAPDTVQVAPWGTIWNFSSTETGIESSLARCYHNLCPELWILSLRFVSNARLYVFQANNISAFGASNEILVALEAFRGGWQIVSSLFVSASELWFRLSWSLQITALGVRAAYFHFILSCFPDTTVSFFDFDFSSL